MFETFHSTAETVSNLKAFILAFSLTHKTHVWKSSLLKTTSVLVRKDFWVSKKIEHRDKSYVKLRKHFWVSHKIEPRDESYVNLRKRFWVSHKIEHRDKSYVKLRKHFWVSHKIEPRDESYVNLRKRFWVSHKIEPRDESETQKTFPNANVSLFNFKLLTLHSSSHPLEHNIARDKRLCLLLRP